MQDLFAFAIARLHADAPRDLKSLRATRKAISKRARTSSPEAVIGTALALDRAGHWLVALELVGNHPVALKSLTLEQVEALGARLSDWGSVDAFGSLLAGPAWLAGAISDEDVLGWSQSPDRWWRRTALVATTVLNTKSRGGSGDTVRTSQSADSSPGMATTWSSRRSVGRCARCRRGTLQRYGASSTTMRRSLQHA